ncbi:sensor histidine kinase [Streptacidiphilus anmyonensis]|uniref:sensor histidine kinase n=1 Tax=Streptacidiphilus anmyonensis TaxID=405782 RepID=UPI000694EB71|nr:histidine kinase [Streptacidiphilus anmyonensis]
MHAPDAPAPSEASPAAVTTVRDRRAYRWGISAMRLAGLAALLLSTARANPSPGAHGRGLAISVAMVVTGAGWLMWLAVEGRPKPLTVALAATAVGGGALGGLSPHGLGVAAAPVAALVAAAALVPEVSVAIAVAAALSLAVSTIAVGGGTVDMLGYLILIGAGLGTGMIRLGYVQRADQAEELLEQTRRAQQAEAEAAVLGERTRIAREIHDILAHSLGALTVQLEAAQALLEGSEATAGDAALGKALGCVQRAGDLARSGLTETRRAVHALREDSALLPELLGRLITGAEHPGREAVQDGSARETRESAPGGGTAPEGARVTLRVEGTARHLEPDAALAILRTAQEAVTNAAKHAPGRPVTLVLAYTANETSLTASNPLPETTTDRPLGATGGGYGLTGLRERALLAGGTLEAGIVDNTWRVCVTIPG